MVPLLILDWYTHRLTPDDIDAVEAHGTGTRLGDPIEAHALLNTYGQHHTPQQPLYLGSLKSNIGHAQAAAGIGGVIKMVQAIQHGELPRTLHADHPSPHIDWDQGHISLLTEHTPWPQSDRPRRAAVSSFGVSGTNAHLIVEQPPATEGSGEDEASEQPDLPTVLTLSARSSGALQTHAARIRAHLDERPEVPLSTVADALAARAALPHRAVIVTRDRAQAREALDAAAEGAPHPALVTGQATDGEESGTVFVFPGQGSQYPGMARTLYTTSPTFRDSIHACQDALAPYIDFTIPDVLTQHPNAPTLDRVDIVQPTLFAVLTALAHHWQHHGIHPHAVIG
ncbi:acyltransferase domain-containing protein, partial [Streptomyces sp. NPDC058964]|uniref:acyltransferase domain-containing protein n=1 Tax=Streptomyces sp. NPDC058964 TaxID=3346681 RepID=UPI0036811724